MGQTLQFYQSGDRSIPFQAQTQAGGFLDYTGAADPIARVWPGLNHATLLTLPAVWTDRPTGYFQVGPIPKSDLATLNAPDSYKVEVTAVLADGTTATLYDGQVVINPAPGTDALPTTYCDSSDIRPLAKWIDSLADARANGSGLLEQRRLAKQWVNRELTSWYEKWARGGGRFSWPAARVGPAPTPQQFRAALEAGGLRITPEIRDMTARYAAGLLGAEQLSASSDMANPYVVKASGLMAKAQELIHQYTAYVSVATPPTPSSPNLSIRISNPWIVDGVWLRGTVCVASV